MKHRTVFLIISFLSVGLTFSFAASDNKLTVDVKKSNVKIPKKYYGYVLGDVKEDVMLRAICAKNAEIRLQNCHDTQEIPVSDEDEAWFDESVKKHQKSPKSTRAVVVGAVLYARSESLESL